MENNQKINCTVESCKYNNARQKACSLKAINVSPIRGVNTAGTDESMCSSYECE